MVVRSEPYRAREISEHLITSSIVAEVFRIKVVSPMCRADGTERFPVLYATDSDAFFDGLAALANSLQLSAEVPRFILVGIGYENARAALLLRWRDFYPQDIRARYQRDIEIVADSPLVSGVDDLSAITSTTDASEFLRFIREELVPFITAQYPTRTDDNSYFGYSAGGGFGLYTLFTQPHTFKRYILGSPGTSHASHHFGIEMAKAFIESRRAINAKVFISVGELEEFEKGYDQLDLVTGYYLLVKYLKASAIPGLELTARVFSGETHASSWPLAFSHGLRTLFGRPVGDTPYLPDFSRR